MEKINYKEIISKYSWIVKEDQCAVVSPDADGVISGLFMSNYLNWSIVGYYDNGKYLILKRGVSAKDCIFLDTDIYRKEIKSCGHHIVLFRNSEIPPNWDNFSNSLNPNILRSRSFKDNFNLKYPMGTVHLLLAILGNKKEIKFSDDALYPILQTDGTINRFLDKYTENLLDWLKYLDAFNKNNALYELLHNKIDLIELSKKYIKYNQFYVKKRKDKIPISDRSASGNLIASSFNKLLNEFSKECRKQIQQYLKFISDKTEWKYKEDKWLWDDFKIFKFTKKICKPGIRTYKDAVKNNFLSLAITSTNNMEYTLEKPDKLP